jgi:UDP:flavonoid glycosyltransferase YjiC (YdhE family)
MRIAYALSPIANGPLDSPPGVGRVSVYPLARYLAAFDAAISAAGYNSFHELLAARIPTLFIPNQKMEMDDQAARANFAARCGMALCAPPDDPYSLTRCLRELVDPSVRSSLRRRMEECRAENGAELAAGIVAELASSLRTGSLRRPGLR